MKSPNLAISFVKINQRSKISQISLRHGGKAMGGNRTRGILQVARRPDRSWLAMLHQPGDYQYGGLAQRQA